MIIALTGSNGYIGGHVLHLALAQGHTIRGIDSNPSISKKETDPERSASRSHPNYSFTSADLHNFEATLDALRGCDAVIHLAAVLGGFNDYLVEVHNSNVVISWNVLRAAAELGITRISVASSVNAIGLVFNKDRYFDYLPVDEAHKCCPDESYGLSKLALELQADALVRRYPHIRVASLRPTYVCSSYVAGKEEDRSTDLWGWVHDVATADAFLRGITAPEGAWAGHERFFICAPTAASDESFEALHQKVYSDIPLKPGSWKGFFDCSKAGRLLGWVHPETI